MNELLKDQVINLIESNSGLKGADLVNRLMSLNLSLSKNDILDLIFDTVQEEELVEIEYVLPNNISKSFLLPKGTKVNIINKVMIR